MFAITCFWVAVSSIVYEVIRPILKHFFFFFNKDILNTQKAHKAHKQLLLRYFYTPKSIQSKHAIFTHILRLEA